MNADRVLALLETNRELPTFPDRAHRKTCYAQQEITAGGVTYHQRDTFEADSETAKALFLTGKIQISRGGYCDVYAIGAYRVSGFKPWYKEDGPASALDNIWVLVRWLGFTRLPIVGMQFDEVPAEFFLPWGTVHRRQYCFADDPVSQKNSAMYALIEGSIGPA